MITKSFQTLEVDDLLFLDAPGALVAAVVVLPVPDPDPGVP